MFKVPSLRLNVCIKPSAAPAIKINSLRSPAKTFISTKTQTQLHFNRPLKSFSPAFYTTSRNVFCHECGTKGIGKFCWNCGTRIFDPATQPIQEQRHHTEKPKSPVNNTPFQQPHPSSIHHNAPPKHTTPHQPQNSHPFEASESEMFPYMFGNPNSPLNLQQLAEQQQQRKHQNNLNFNPNPAHTNIPNQPSQGVPLGNIFGSAVGAGLSAAAVRQNNAPQQPHQQQPQDRLTPEELARELEEFAQEQQLLNALQRPHSLEEEALDDLPLEAEEEENEGVEEDEDGEDDDTQPIQLHVIYPDRL